jgi:hypothetical protein
VVVEDLGVLLLIADRERVGAMSFGRHVLNAAVCFYIKDFVFMEGNMIFNNTGQSASNCSVNMGQGFASLSVGGLLVQIQLAEGLFDGLGGHDFLDAHIELTGETHA